MGFFYSYDRKLSKIYKIGGTCRYTYRRLNNELLNDRLASSFWQTWTPYLSEKTNYLFCSELK